MSKITRPAGVREIDPRPKRVVAALPITEPVGPGIRRVVARIMPLERWDGMGTLSSYAELLLLMRLQPDDDTLTEIMSEARERLTDADYEMLLGYKELLISTRLGISAEVMQ
mgnify:CR=1 FL=1